MATPNIPQLAIVSLQDLRTLLTEIVTELMQDQAPALLDRAALAKALSCSPAKIDELRRREGFPTIWLGTDSPRFEVQAVLTFLRGGDTQ